MKIAEVSNNLERVISSKDLKLHCLKSVRIRSFSGPYFPAFGLHTENTEY